MKLEHLSLSVACHGMPTASGMTDAQQPADRRTDLLLRTLLIQALLRPESTPTLEALNLRGAPDAKLGLDYWLTRLQVSWYAGDHHGAIQASSNAAELIGPLTPETDVLCRHLFSVLALGYSSAATAEASLDVHCLSLHRLACARPASAGAIAELACAVRDRRAGRTVQALQVRCTVNSGHSCFKPPAAVC